MNRHYQEDHTFNRIMWVSIWLAIIAVVVIFWLTESRGAAHAAPLAFPAPVPVSEAQQPACVPDAVTQYDLEGVYEARYVMVEAHPCGGTTVRWLNTYGEHVSVYYAEHRIKTGGVIAQGYKPDRETGMYMDNVPYISLTPAEPGWVYLTTISEEGGIVRRYRLNKTS